MDSLLPEVDEHYFTGAVASASERRELSVWLGGREVTVEVAGGVFSPGRLDPGTAVLLKQAPVPEPGFTGNLLDVGCGWGPIAIHLALACPDATIWAVDVSERAVDLARRNAERLGLSNIRVGLPNAIPDDVSFDGIWSNPPIRVGKEALHALLSRWIPRLAPDGEAWLVVAKQLGADSLARWIGSELARNVTRAATSKGYRILRVS